MDVDLTYELVYDAVRKAISDTQEGDGRLLRRFEGGRVLFEDRTGKVAKELSVDMVFKKVTSVREKLRVLEQKINNNGGLTGADKADLQSAITRCYGSLTTFNFLFADEKEKFKGSAI